MEKIPTASEFYAMKRAEDPDYRIPDPYQCMIEFAKLRVEAALKAASESVDTGGLGVTTVVKIKLSILNAYPLDNIK